MAGLLLVSGCPRSGTSLCMDIQRLAHGEDVILGEKFPQEGRKKALEEMKEQQEGESKGHTSCRAYLTGKQDEARELDEDREGLGPLTLEADQSLGEDQVPRRGDGQKLRQPLDDAEHQGGPEHGQVRVSSVAWPSVRAPR